MRILNTLITGALMLGVSASASAGLNLSATRVIYEENNKEASLKVNDKAPDGQTQNLNPVLIYSRVENWMPGDELGKNAGTAKSTPSSDFILTPPLFTLRGKPEDKDKDEVSNQLRILYTGKPGALPADRESIYWLAVRSIPKGPKNPDGSTLTIALQYNIKLIYRPKGLSSEGASDAWKRVDVRRQGGSIVMNNRSAYYVSVGSMTSGGKDVKTAVTLPPFTEVKVPDAGRGAITWTAINDYGGLSAKINAAG